MRIFKEELDAIKAFCESDKYTRENEKMLARLKNSPIVLYGAGALGVKLAGILINKGLDVACFCDTYKTGVQKETGLPIISPKALLDKHQEAVIVISAMYFIEEIRDYLLGLKIPSERIFSTDCFFNLEQVSREEVEKHIDGYGSIFDVLEDDKSKDIVMERIKIYLSSLPIILDYNSSIVSPLKEQYFDADIIQLTDNEIFIDGGLYIGDTAEQFIAKVNGKYKHYYGFEPDKDNFLQAEKKLVAYQNITIVPKGLWCKEERLCFDGGLAASSAIGDTGTDYIDVISLDNYLPESVVPTFIKMDIEGAEFSALKGAERIIRNHKPKLAICAYHKMEDIYTLPELIKSYCSDYQFYFRHYTNSTAETVLYAVCKNK